MPQAVPTSHRPTGAAELIELFEAADIRRSSLIRVTGPSGLSALLWLCRHGFEQVGYQRAGFGPSEQPDALLVAHTCDAAALEHLLVAGPHVHDGGVLIFQCAVPISAGLVAHLLETYGYRVERRLHGVRRDLYLARRCSSPRMLKAA
ncbi:MAG: hypothetical protein J0I28_04625 [Caulobacterales bacterium]|nr:hypothetical protein [Caulobacterales bacterium]